MGFNDLTLDSAEQAALEQLVTAVRQPDYRPVPGGPPAPNQVLENLDNDPQIPDEPAAEPPASRRQLIKALKNSSDTPAVCLSRGNEFCWSHPREGRPEEGVSTLGHVHELTKVADWLHDATGGLSRAETRDWLRDLVNLPGDEGARLVEQKAAITKDTLSPYQMWSFHEDDKAPFTDLEPRRAELLNRLGLGFVIDPTAELTLWTHTLPSDSKACRPTAWDADMGNPWWRPTGKTEPLDGSGRDRGFPEVVHAPIGPEHLVTSIAEPEI